MIQLGYIQEAQLQMDLIHIGAIPMQEQILLIHLDHLAQLPEINLVTLMPELIRE